MPENAQPEQPARVFLLIENRLVRETLVRLFRKPTDISVVGLASSIDAADVVASKCDILVLDDLQTLLSLESSLHGRPAARRIAIVVLGMEEDEEQFLMAIRSGVTGFLLNDASASDVVAAVRSTARGEAVCPPRMCLSLFRLVAKAARKPPVAPLPSPSLTELTIRQQQLISLVAKGLTNKQIASALNLSEFTIKNHIHRIMKQVAAGSRSQAVEAARSSGYSLIV